MALSLPIAPEANKLLNRNGLMLLTAMVLDQQIPLEKAFSSPWVLVERLGHEPTAAELAGFEPEALAEIFGRTPALHRFPKAMAARVQEVCAMLVERYDGDPARLWNEAATGKDLVKRIAELPGFGKQKSQIFAALLGKQFGVTPEGWREAAGVYGEDGSRRSVADIVDQVSLAQVREYKQSVKAAAKP
ncbi:HhH-GPD-type base excision DNA repair protein [Catenuloplanes sp. NPDC051500]|uniref:HhH-GPD-type base excision DNA repair protein n=1 Tax=Catenuloplanes sp. NPDC051500 TaxID=3363959 RepID=UPI00378BBFB3